MATAFFTSVDLLSSVPLDPDYRNTLDFATLNAQNTYFQSKIAYSTNQFTSLSYQRYLQGSIKLEAPINLLTTVNYLRFKNANYTGQGNLHENKWFYAFITNMEYVSDTVVKIDYEIDVMQTWLTNYTLNPCYVVREHTNDDTFGANVVDEGLETGDYIAQDMEALDRWFSHAIDTQGNITLMGYYLVLATQAPEGGQGWYSIGGTPTTLWYSLAFNMSGLTDIIYSFKNGATHNLDPIIGIYLVPPGWHSGEITSRVRAQYALFVGKTFTLTKDWDVGFGPFKTFNSVTGNTFYSYSAKNRKTLTYPYNFMVLESPDGSSMNLKYENFKDIGDHIEFDGGLTLFPYVQTIMSPKFYECYQDLTSSDGETTIRINPKYALCCKAYPTCGVGSDAFMGWWAQNKYSMPSIDAGIEVSKKDYSQYYTKDPEWNKLMKLTGSIGDWLDIMFKGSGSNTLKSISALGRGAGALLTGDMASLNNTMSLADTIGDQLASYKGHQAMPNTVASKAENGGIVHATEIDCYKVYYMRIKPQYAEIIDNYFSCYGYATQTVKIPNTTGRRNWNYVQTKGCTLSGNIPSEAERKISAIFDRGITIWHNPSTILDYSQDNSIIV